MITGKGYHGIQSLFLFGRVGTHPIWSSLGFSQRKAWVAYSSRRSGALSDAVKEVLLNSDPGSTFFRRALQKARDFF